MSVRRWNNGLAFEMQWSFRIHNGQINVQAARHRDRKTWLVECYIWRGARGEHFDRMFQAADPVSTAVDMVERALDYVESGT